MSTTNPHPGAAPPPRPRDLRRHRRFEPTLKRARLSWPEDPDGGAPARLFDLSAGGAAVLTEQPPPGAHAFLSLADADGAEVVRARVVHIEPIAPGAFMIRLAFDGGRPTEFLHAALLGGPAPRDPEP